MIFRLGPVRLVEHDIKRCRDVEHGVAHNTIPDPNWLPTDLHLEILRHVGNGLSDAAIASRCFISERTVRRRLAEIGRQLQAHSRPMIVAGADERGWL
jgi:DNA-binding NarL/FixJ family response regulator